MKLFKKIIVITIVIMAFLITSSYAETATVTIEAARIRAEKNTTSTIVTVVYEDDEVELLEKESQWSKVKYGEFSGYIKTEFLNFADAKENTDNTANLENTTSNENNSQNNNNVNKNENQNLAPENTQNTEPLAEDEIYISSNTNMKLLPNFMSKNIHELQKGQKYRITLELNNWVKVTDGSVEGWILKNKTTKENVAVEPSVNENTVQEDNTTNTTANNVVENNVTENTVNTTVENKVENEADNTQTDRNGSVDSKNTGTVNVETAILREKATTESKNIGLLDYGDVVTIVGEENDFYKITFENENGYISKKLLTVDEKKSTSRSLVEERKDNQESSSENIKKDEENKDTNQISDMTNNSVADYARQYLNYPYILGGKTPDTGFDCSGFTRHVYKNFGYNLSSTSAGQTNVGDEINSKEELLPGDLILFLNEEKTKIGHTGIYLGNNEFIHAANPERGVVIDNISTNSYYNERFVSARRIVK